MIKLIDLLNENLNDIVYTYRSQKSIPDIKANGIKMSDKNKQNSEDYNIPDFGYTYYTSTSKNTNWVNNNPYGDSNTPYTVRVSIDLNKIKNDKNYTFKDLNNVEGWSYPEYQEVRIYSNTKNRIPPEYIKSIDIFRRKSGDEYGWDFTGELELEPEVKKYIDNVFKNNPNLDLDSFPYDEIYEYFTEFWGHEDEEYDNVSKEVMDYIKIKTTN
jgi:hypothetical protein